MTNLSEQLAQWREANPEPYTPKTTPEVRAEVVRVAQLIMARHYAETLAEIVEDLNNAEAALNANR